MHKLKNILHLLTFSQLDRDMNEYKGRVESYSREMLRKESQIKELQTRMETGDGRKLSLLSILTILVCRELFCQM